VKQAILSLLSREAGVVTCVIFFLLLKVLLVFVEMYLDFDYRKSVQMIRGMGIQSKIGRERMGWGRGWYNNDMIRKGRMNTRVTPSVDWI
jgi:hypothetical protein